MSTKQTNIGLFGFGVVGQGFYDFVSREGIQENIPSVVVKSKSKKRKVNSINFITDGTDLLSSEEPSIIVEAINNEEDAFEIVAKALIGGKQVISASKKLVANRLEELLRLENKYGGTLLYEAAVAGSIPVVRVLNDFYSNENITSIKGILNGTSNYILTQLFNSDLSYELALTQAQEKGFAESDPTSDVGGFDALYKLVILTLQGFGKIVHPSEIYNLGIEQITKDDIDFAKQAGLKIKQIATVKIENNHLQLSVVPTLVDSNNELYYTDEEYNAVQIVSETIGVQYYKGKGAGSNPTGSAVYADLKALERGYRYTYKKETALSFTNQLSVDLLLRLPEGLDIEAITIKKFQVKQLNNNLFYIQTTQHELIDNKKHLEQLGVSLLFFDNKAIKSKIVGDINEVTVNELFDLKKHSKDFQLIDVREKWEFEFANIGGELIPLGEIENNLSVIDKDKQVIVLCRSGKRSASAIEFLQKKYNFKNLYNLKGGILAWSEEIDTTIEKY